MKRDDWKLGSGIKAGSDAYVVRENKFIKCVVIKVKGSTPTNEDGNVLVEFADGQRTWILGKDVKNEEKNEIKSEIKVEKLSKDGFVVGGCTIPYQHIVSILDEIKNKTNEYYSPNTVVSYEASHYLGKASSIVKSIGSKFAGITWAAEQTMDDILKTPISILDFSTRVRNIFEKNQVLIVKDLVKLIMHIG